MERFPRCIVEEVVGYICLISSRFNFSDFIPEMIKRMMPNFVKHPLMTYGGWSWRMRGFPSMSPTDIKIIESVFMNLQGRKLNVFEWGSGSSTIYYSKFLRHIGLDFEWCAVDNSSIWYEFVLKKIDRANLADYVNLYCFGFPAFWEHDGYINNGTVSFDTYGWTDDIANYLNLPKELDRKFDVLVVDGRFRKRCLEVAREVLSPGGVVILHDAFRVHYHSALSLFSQVSFVDSETIPGSKQQSTIALCGTDNSSFIEEITSKYTTSS